VELEVNSDVPVRTGQYEGWVAGFAILVDNQQTGQWIARPKGRAPLPQCFRSTGYTYTPSMNEEVQFQRPELMPLSILRAVWKRKLLIGVVFLFLTVTSIAIVMALPAVYGARAVILIEEQRIPERFVATTVNEGLDSRLNRISQQILAYDNLVRLIDDLELYPEDRGTLSEEALVLRMREDIRVLPVQGMTVNRGNTTAFQIAYEGSLPEHVAQVANRLAGNFVDENLRTRTNAALGTSEFIDAQIKDAEANLAKAEGELRDYRQRFMGELPEQEGAVSADISRNQVQYQAAVGEVARVHQSKMFLENSLNSAIATLEIATRAANDEREAMANGGVGTPTGSAGRARLTAATTRYEALRARYSESHPDVVRAKEYVAELEGTAEAEAATSVASEVPAPEASTQDLSVQTAQAVLQAETRVAQLRTQLVVLEEDLQAADIRRGQVSASLSSSAAKMGRIPLHQQELASVQRAYDTALLNWQELIGKSFDANLATTMEQRERSERFSVLESARVPSGPVWPPREMYAGGSALAALILAGLLGFLLELKNNVVLGEWEMPAHVPVLGRIPIIDTDEMTGEMGSRRDGLFTGKRVLVGSSLLLSMVAMVVATSLYFGWISF
jgi:succinoglycan biosynthesis transport protein ExoP